MATTTPPSTNASSTPAPTATQPDWPAQAADAIVEQVGKIRDKTTGPALRAAHYFVFSFFALVLVPTALILLVVGLVRLLDAYLPDAVFGETHMWAAHTILGTILVLGGLFTARKMKKAGAR